MQTNQKAINIIKKYEGCRLSAYKCPAGKWTIGYGHVGCVNKQPILSGMTITQAQADEIFKGDLTVFERHVKTIVKIPLNQNQFSALVSFAFNCGAGNLKKLTANRNTEQISKAILLYNKSNGKTLLGLARRRKEEQSLFNEKMPV